MWWWVNTSPAVVTALLEPEQRLPGQIASAVQLQCINPAAQTILRVLTLEERAEAALETAVS